MHHFEHTPGHPRTLIDLLDSESVSGLAPAVRARFSRRWESGSTTCYRGKTVHTHLSPVGWCLAQLARLIGSPLPLHEQASLATVIVTDHPGAAGQIWTRLYHTHAWLPQVIQSVKRFTGPTGLEEDLGFGFTIALELSVCDGALVFSGTDYYWRAGDIRLRLPRWLTPGTLCVKNWQGAGTDFYFSLALDHPRLGSLIKQLVCFDDETTSTRRAVAAEAAGMPIPI